MKTNILIGKTITAVHLAEDKMAIKFDIEGGDPIVAKVDGDCCSRTWIENVENPEALIGSPVLQAESVHMPTPQSGIKDDGDVITFYGFKISTAKGTCVLDYRNASNGYYGGDLHWPDDTYYYGGVFGQNISKEEWKVIT